MNATTIVEITLAIRAPPISRAFFRDLFFYLKASTHILARNYLYLYDRSKVCRVRK